LGGVRQLFEQIVDGRLHGAGIVDERLGSGVDPGFDNGHCYS
jgi:hypothetical protein